MSPYWQPEVDELVRVSLQTLEWARLIDQHRDADFAYAMNTTGEDGNALGVLAGACRRVGIPTIWHNIEDPNSFSSFVAQAAGFDVVATSDAVLIPEYQRRYPRAKVIWLPLAAQPAMHQPHRVRSDATDLILIANWYTNDARLAAVRTLLDPLIGAGFSLTLRAYEVPGWPERYRRWWRGATSAYDVAQFYPEGRIALGMNNQAWGTAMCSMRTFEALACGKPFLSFHSDAYARLGFVKGEHFVWTDDAETAVRWAVAMLAGDGAQEMADHGREFVLAHHTYRHRLEALLAAVGGGVLT